MKTKDRYISDNGNRILYLGVTIILVLGGVSIFLLPFIFSEPSSSRLDYSKYGPIGDFVNGVSAPFIAIVTSCITFLAFFIQYRANVEQRRQFIKSLNRQNTERKEQERAWLNDRFDTTFYELWRLHVANVNEFNINDQIRGRKCFEYMLYELKFIYTSVERNSHITYLGIDEFSDEVNIMKISYALFFNGIKIDINSADYSYYNKTEKYLLNIVVKYLEEVQKKIDTNFKLSPGSNSVYLHNLYNNIHEQKREELFHYIPFKGHNVQLGQYFRHLYHTARYVIKNNHIFREMDDARNYITTLRTQLSSYEQLLLYYNSLAWYQKEWKILFTKYRLIKNLPLIKADFDKSPLEYFAEEIEKGDVIFDWQENKSN